MCLFPFSNNNPNSKAYKKGVIEFECGACPECLGKRSRQWALRASMQALEQNGCMITLTYDQFIRDDKNHVIGEQLVLREVDKKDVQLFIKRLRARVEYTHKKDFEKGERKKYFALYSHIKTADGLKQVKRNFVQYKKSDFYKKELKKYLFDKCEKISYITTAEYGKRTHRPHYHLLIFGFNFPDRIFYKKSKRGNSIYQSPLLEKLWGKGICTVDCVNLNAKCARYCTKYCSKDYGADDTFMLFSRGIGENKLLEKFNGKSYFVEGVEYSIPRLIWRKWFSRKRPDLQYIYRSYAYLSEKCWGNEIKTFPCGRRYDSAYAVYRVLQAQRDKFTHALENEPLYQSYLQYWKERGELHERFRPSPLYRILALDNRKYFDYKQKALRCHNERIKWLRLRGTTDYAIPPPRSGCTSRYFKFLDFICPPPLVIKGQMTENFEKRYKPFNINDLFWRPLPDKDNPFIPKKCQISIFD